jgi:hypothetical protein
MKFRLIHLIKKDCVRLDSGQRFSFRYPGPDPVKVKLRVLTHGETERYADYKAALRCEATMAREVSKEILEVYDRLSRGLMHKGFVKPKTKSAFDADNYPYVDGKGNIKPKTVPALKLFRDDFQKFQIGILHELTDAIKQTVKAARWRSGQKGAHSPIALTLGLSWSLDGTTWRKMPSDAHVRIGLELLRGLNSDDKKIINKLLRKREFEPLGHELFLEAWAVRNNNPRSALVVGVSAAEVGFKQLVAKLVPDAEWIVGNVPSPPLMNMVTKYLPLLPVKRKIQERVLIPPKSVRKAIDEAVQLRNKTTHVGHAAPKDEQLDRILLAIRDLLYLLDYYCGHEWAIWNLRQETLQEMKSEHNLI